MPSCEYCGKDFIKTHNVQKFCKEDCRIKNHNKKKKRPIKVMKCEYCEEAYNNGTARQKYCSENCRVKAKARRVAKPSIKKECIVCREQFTVEGKSRLSVYCSEDCRKQRWKKRLIEKNCANCNQPFKADKRTLCCSNECRTEYFDTRVELYCIICGEKFKTYKSRIEREASQKCCSEDCVRCHFQWHCFLLF